MGLTQRELCLSTSSDTPSQWFALTVKHQHERTTQSALESKLIPTLLPMYRVRNEWSDRTRELEVPLFSGYVFCRFPYSDRVRVLRTPGVRRIVGFGDAAYQGKKIDTAVTVPTSNS